MKTLYGFLQNYAWLICIVFGISPDMPSYLQHTYGSELASYASWILLFVSALLFFLCYWWLTATWCLPKPANMAAITVAAVLGLMMSSSSLVDIYGHGAGFYFMWRNVPAHVLQAVMIICLLCQVFVINPFEQNPKDG